MGKINEKMYTTSAVSVGGRNGHVKSADGFIDMDLRTPGAMGGPGGATTPEDLFASGYAACFNGALNLAASLSKIKVGETKVTVEVSLGKDADGNLQLGAKIEAIVPGVDQATAQQLVDKA